MDSNNVQYIAHLKEPPSGQIVLGLFVDTIFVFSFEVRRLIKGRTSRSRSLANCCSKEVSIVAFRSQWITSVAQKSNVKKSSNWKQVWSLTIRSSNNVQSSQNSYVIIDDPLLKRLTNPHSADPLSIYVLDQSRTPTGFCSKDLPIVALIAANHRRSIVLFTTRRADPNLCKSTPY